MAGNASSNSGYYPIYTTGYDPYPFSSGGTSAVAPLYAGLFTVINAAIGARVGFINPILYALGNKVCSDVNPAIVGGPSDNGFNGTMGYPAGASWDACTGWGSINGNALLSALASSSWVDNDLTEFAHGTPASGGSPLAAYSQNDGSQHVNFIDADGHVHELYRNPAAQWVDNDLTEFAHGTPASGDSPLAAYSQNDGSQHVNFIVFDFDGNGNVHELYRNPDPAAQWVDNDLTTYAIGGTPALLGSPLDGYSQNDGSQHVNFLDANGNVHELYRNPDPAAQWVDNPLTALAHGTPAARVSALDGYSQNDGSQHVNFLDANGNVHELYRNPDPAAQWVDNPLTALAHGTPGRKGQCTRWVLAKRRQPARQFP